MRLRLPRLLEILERIYNRLFEIYLDEQSNELSDRILSECQKIELLIQSVAYVQCQTQQEVPEPPLTQSPEESSSYSGQPFFL